MRPEQRVQKLIEWFIKAAVAHAQALEEMEEFEAATQVTSLNRYYSAIKREGGIERLLDLLEHPDPAVAGMAAVYGMRDDPERCCALLADLAKAPGMLGFRAEIALRRWESGEWSL